MTRSVATRLETASSSTTVSAFPDGSVDHVCTVFDGSERIVKREAFADRFRSGSPTFRLETRTVEPGGHAVNMALQAATLGEDVTCVGHLDDAVFSEVPFETVSMGDPARVTIQQFTDGDVLMVEPSAAIEQWSFEAMRDLDRPVASLLSTDVIFCTNWTSFATLPAALNELAAMDVAGDLFIFDPGRIPARPAEEILALMDSLAALGESMDVVLAVNGHELESLVGALSDGDERIDGDGKALARVRSIGELEAAVLHETELAMAVTQERRERVENVAVEPVRNTGGGDRFDAGLAFALAREWSWRDALLLANTCATRYIATGQTSTREELATFLRERWE